MELGHGSTLSHTSCSDTNFGDRASSLTSEHSSDGTNSLNPSPVDGPNPMASPPSLLGRCRSANDLDTQADTRVLSKLARFDSFPARHLNPAELHINTPKLPSALMYSGSFWPNSHLCNSTYSSTSTTCGTHPGYGLTSQGKVTRVDDMGLPHMFTGGVHSAPARAISLPVQGFDFNTGLALPSAGIDGARSLGGRSLGPFTQVQWAEFNQQTYVFKHLAAGVSPPRALLLPIINSVAAMKRAEASSIQMGSNAAGFSPGAQSTIDPEPGRCRRTDGKKWRCAKEVVQDQKYCERHLHRGRHRPRAKASDTPSASPASQRPGAAVPSGGAGVDNASSAASSVTSVPANRSGVETRSNAECVVHPSQQQKKPAARAQPPAAVASSSIPSSSGLCRDSQLFSQLQPSTMPDDRNRNLRSVSNAHLPSMPSPAPASAGFQQLLQSAQGVSSLSMLNSVASKFLTSDESNMDLLKDKTFRYIFTEAAANDDRVDPFVFPAAHIGMLNGGRLETEDFPFRQFMNDWPRPRDSPSLSCSDVDGKQKCTELSISSHMFPPTLSAEPLSSSFKQCSSPLRLSMMKDGGEEDSVGMDGARMGLSMGVTGAKSGDEVRDYRQQSNWIPIARDDPLVGGPLAEALQSSSTPRGFSSGSLNLLGEGWDNYHRAPNLKESSRQDIASSPTGVLQKVTLGCNSDCSSSGSSPRSSALKMDQSRGIHRASDAGPSIML